MLLTELMRTGDYKHNVEHLHLDKRVKLIEII